MNPSDKISPKRDIAVWQFYLVFIGCVLVIFFPLLLNSAIFGRLPALQFYPWHQFAFNELREGRVPFWNPYLGGGAPLIANYQSAIFYPPNWLHLFLPDVTAMNLLVIFHMLWAGLGVWQFTRLLKLSPFGQSVSVMSFALGLYYVGHVDNFPLSATAAWLPWLFWATHRTLEKRRLGDVGILAILTGIQLLAGHAQNAWYGFLGLGGYALWYSLTHLPVAKKRTRILALSMTFIGILLGAGIASGQLLLTFEFLFMSHRTGGVDYDTLTQISYEPWRLLNLISPTIAGRPQNDSYLLDNTRYSFFEDTVYIGLLPLVSVFYAISGWRGRRKFLHHHELYRTVPFWLLLSLLGYTFALGKYSPLYPFLYAYVPTFDAFREPAQWLILPAFSLSILAGIGVHNWSRSQSVFFVARLIVVGGLGMTILLLIIFMIFSPQEIPLRNLIYAMLNLGILAAGCAWLTLRQPDNHLLAPMWRWQLSVLLFIGFDLIWVSWGVNTFVPRTYYERDYSITAPQGRLYWFEDDLERKRDYDYFTPQNYEQPLERWAEIRTTLFPNQSMNEQIQTFNNFDALQPAVHREYIELIEQKPNNLPLLLQAAGIGQVNSEAGESYTTSATQAPPLVWVVPQAVWIENNKQAQAILLSSDWSPDTTVILQEGDFSPPDSPTYSTPPSIRLIESTPDKIRYRVVTDGVGYLVIATTWYPGWTATIDGQEVPLYRANLAFQAVELPPNGGDVVLQYEPRPLGSGLLISVISLLMAVFLSALYIFRYAEEDITPSLPSFSSYGNPSTNA